MPAPSALTSNAALTAGGPRPLEGGFDLRIGGAAGTPAGSPGKSGDPWVGPGGGPGVQLRRPEPAADPGAPRELPSAAPATGPAAARVTSYEQAQALLAAYGVTWQRLEKADGGWKFTCSVPRKQNPNVSRTYEAQARDDVGALRAALEQIAKEQ
jgi:hypothetical protein